MSRSPTRSVILMPSRRCARRRSLLYALPSRNDSQRESANQRHGLGDLALTPLLGGLGRFASMGNVGSLARLEANAAAAGGDAHRSSRHEHAKGALDIAGEKAGAAYGNEGE